MGTYLLEFQACPQNETTVLDVLKYCGPKYAVTVDFVERGGFSDVPFNHLNAETIDYVQANGIVSGYPDGTFRPDQTINRAEFVKIITIATFGQTMVD